MKILVFLLALAALAVAEERKKRQTNYGGGYGGNYGGAAAYRQPPQHQQQQPAPYQPQQPSYRPQQASYQGHQQVQHFPAQHQQPYHASPPRQHATAPGEEEKDEGPHPLQLLLEKSKFDCGGKSDGYYADSDVACQAFHYCVSGHKHSMMCPAGTVFHQVHLNCVPSDQDICSKANKFFFVNDYLNKPLEQRGPNNTIQYHQRYYPEGYAVGDPFIPPQEQHKREPPAATYGLGPAYREQSPQPVSVHHQSAPNAPYAPQQHGYAPQQRPAYHQQQQVQTRPASYQPQSQSRPVIYQPQAHARPAVYQQPSSTQSVNYGYGAQQQAAHQAQALQAQRAYAQQQQQAAAGPHQYGYGHGGRPRYTEQY